MYDCARCGHPFDFHGFISCHETGCECPGFKHHQYAPTDVIRSITDFRMRNKT